MLSEQTVKSIMSANLIAVQPETLVSKVKELFDIYDIHHIPVISQTGTCVGIISVSDIYQLQDKFTKFRKSSDEENNQFFKSLLAEEIMTCNPVSIDAGMTIADVLEFFIDSRYRALIVTNEDRCVGIVTPFDLLDHINGNAIKADGNSY